MTKLISKIKSIIYATQQLNSKGIEIHRTDLEGNISILTDGKDYLIEYPIVVPNTTTVEIPLYHNWNLISLPVVPNREREFLSASQELASYQISAIILAILLWIAFLLWLWLKSKRHLELPLKDSKIPEFQDYFR